MSRLAKIPIKVPKGCDISMNADNIVTAKGPKGSDGFKLTKGIKIVKEDDSIIIQVDSSFNVNKAMIGLNWALLRNLIMGVSKGFEKRLSMIGVGYRAAVEKDKLDLKVGYSHVTALFIPNGVEVKVERGNAIVVCGVNKQAVGQFASEVRAKKKPEPYKGKGIRYKDEYVRKKAGKTGKNK